MSWEILPFIFLCFGILLFLIAYILNRQVRYKRRQHHLPPGTIAYSDLHTPGQPLFSVNRRLTGKPDYILKVGNKQIPVEYKSGYYDNPQTHHKLQLAAYCQLIEDVDQCFIPYGWIIYPTGHFQIAFDPKLRMQLNKILEEIRESIHGKTVILNHNNPRKCQHCSFRNICSDLLT